MRWFNFLAWGPVRGEGGGGLICLSWDSVVTEWTFIKKRGNHWGWNGENVINLSAEGSLRGKGVNEKGLILVGVV